jgi:hypothetical protein
VSGDARPHVAEILATNRLLGVADDPMSFGPQRDRPKRTE